MYTCILEIDKEVEKSKEFFFKNLLFFQPFAFTL